MDSDRSFGVATPHRAATAAGVAVLRRGGTAAEAAVAANAVLTVVYPHMCSIGGDLFALLAMPDSEPTAINGSGGAALSIDSASMGLSRMPLSGPLTITVPGTVSAWETLLSTYGRGGLDRVLDPAIKLAAKGVQVSHSLAIALLEESDAVLADAGLRSVFAPEGRLLREGEYFAQPKLAQSLDILCREGGTAFYHGSVGAHLVAGLQRLGAPLTFDDLADHATEITTPLRGQFRGLEVLVPPPNSQGFVLLEILAACQRLRGRLDLDGPDAVDVAGICRIASHDRDRLLGDPRHAELDVEALLSPEYASELASRARSAREVNVKAVPGDTVAIVALDREGGAICVVQSTFHTFGAKILEPTTGIVCHNRGSYFSVDSKSPNAIGPGRRPAHTLMPTMLFKDGRFTAAIGTMGGNAQPQVIAQLVIRLVDGSQSLMDAVAAPRWVVGGMELDDDPHAAQLEPGLAGLKPRFAAAGHTVELISADDERTGHAQGIVRQNDGTLVAASDPRADGSAYIGTAPR